MTLRTPRGRAAALAVLVVLPGCQAGGLPDLSDLAREPPMRYSVLVTGGAFVHPGPDDRQSEPMLRTYRPDGELAEAFPLDLVIEALEAARVFVRTERDDSAPEARSRLARQTQPALPGDAEPLEFLRRARGSGHDLVLVVERVEDGAVEYRGINGQWPITAVAWLLIGLGLLIPDHTYESHASLHVALRDVRTGGAVVELVMDASTVDLPLTQRTDFLGYLVSIVVPPFWVGDDEERVEAVVRDVTSGQLVASMVRQMKTVDVEERLSRHMPAALTATPTATGLRVRADARESLSVLRMRVDGEPLRGPQFDAFEAGLLASVRQRGDRLVYEGTYPGRISGSRLQVLVQSVTGRVASVTVPLPEPGAR